MAPARSFDHPLIIAAPDSPSGAVGAGEPWWPVCGEVCTFDPAIYITVMENLVRNPNITSSWLFRADILHDDGAEGADGAAVEHGDDEHGDNAIRVVDRASHTKDSVGQESPTITDAPVPAIPSFSGFEQRRRMVRRMIPRNTDRDRLLDQTCVFYESQPGHAQEEKKTLVVYLPHVASAAEMPFYNPKTRGIAFLHEWDPASSRGAVSISYQSFDTRRKDTTTTADAPAADTDARKDATRLKRTGLHLLEIVLKHGQGLSKGYVKRVQHDVLLPQAAVQDRYAALKRRHARALLRGWAESTDPTKHVFEDLAIAAFLIELWADMYRSDRRLEPSASSPASSAPAPARTWASVAATTKAAAAEPKPPFPGFVDIGCGNGLLVYILNQEGFSGWGFDARRRRSWAAYNTLRPGPDGPQDSLQELILIPWFLQPEDPDPTATEQPPTSAASSPSSSSPLPLSLQGRTHPGRFPAGTFIISNHADELTPWTPILAAAAAASSSSSSSPSGPPSPPSPFIMIPCCSHALSGVRFRAPLAPRDRGVAETGYASLCEWVADIARDCGWKVEREMLRIPSTRNMAMVGRRRSDDYEVDVRAVVAKYGGAVGYAESMAGLAEASPGVRH